MRFSINIDLIRSRQWGLNLTEATVFAFCYDLPAWAEHIILDGVVYCFASKTKIIEELPIVTDKPDTIYRILKSLEEKGLIEYAKQGRKDLIRTTEKGKEWNRKNSEKNPTFESNSEKNPSKLGKKSESNSEKNPTDKYISILGNKDEGEQPAAPTPSPTHLTDIIEKLKQEKPGRPDAEYRIGACYQAIMDHIEKYPAYMYTILAFVHSGEKPDTKTFQIEVMKCVRYNCKDAAFLSDPVAYIPKLLPAWFERWDKWNNAPGKKNKQDGLVYVRPKDVY